MKGVETDTNRLPMEIVAAVAPDRPAAILTGPNFAHELARSLPAAAVVAGVDPALRREVIERLGTRTYRLYGSGDPVGAQVGGAAKNVIAIAAGIVDRRRSGRERPRRAGHPRPGRTHRLAVALGGRGETVAGLSGLGDLLLTCTGPASRNFRLGLALGQGAGRLGRAHGLAIAPALVEGDGGGAAAVCCAVAAGGRAAAILAAAPQCWPGGERGGRACPGPEPGQIGSSRPWRVRQLLLDASA